MLHAETVSCKAEAGQEVRVPVSADRNTGYAVGSVFVNWNADALILKEIEYNADLAPANFPAPVKNSGSYRVSFGDFLAAENYSGTGVLFTLVFTVADGAQPDSYPIAFSKPDFLDKDANKMTAACTDGAVQLGTGSEPGFLRGDVNEDGVVSVQDAQLALINYTEQFAGNPISLTDAQFKAVDVTQDGVLTVEDAQYILIYYTERQVAGKEISWDELIPPKQDHA